MKRRGSQGPTLDMVDVLQIRLAARLADAPQMDPDLREEKQRQLVEMAAGHGFGSVAAMRAEADAIYAAKGMGGGPPSWSAQ